MADTLSDKTKSGSGFNSPTTSTDHENMEKWVYGDEVKGSFVKSLGAWKRYRDDINRAYGNEADYYDGNVVYIDTMKPIGKQLKKFG